MKITKVMTYLLSIVVLISIAIGVNGCMSEQDEILEYLEEKYGQKFEVERYWSEYDGSSYLSHKMIAYPTDYPELSFKAGKYRDSVGQKDVLWDNYIQIKWSREYSETHKARLLAIDKREMDVQFEISVSGQPTANFLNKSMEDYLATKKGEESQPAGIVGIVIKAEKEPDKNQEADFIYRIYKQIETMGLNSFTLDVWYVKSASYDHARKISKLMQLDENISIAAVGEGNWFYRVNVWDVDKVTSPTDFVKFFSREE